MRIEALQIEVVKDAPLRIIPEDVEIAFNHIGIDPVDFDFDEAEDFASRAIMVRRIDGRRFVFDEGDAFRLVGQIKTDTDGGEVEVICLD